jgi:hypothetical protein
VAAFVPAKPFDLLPIRSLAAWVVIGKVNDDTATIGGMDRRFVIHARIEATDAAAAEALLARIDALWKHEDIPAECRDQVDAVAKGVTIQRSGRVVVLHLDLHGPKLVGLVVCSMKRD